MNYNTVQILGIPFFKGKVNEVFEILKHKGGLLTVPAAPGLATIENDNEYYKSIRNSDLIIPDSGYMILIWNFFNSEKIHKISGLTFINYFLKQIKNSNVKNLFLINPSDIDGNLNSKLINSLGMKLNEDDNYTAPFYDLNVIDYKLLELIEYKKPDWILINIGGGIQEKLGYFLKENLSYKPAIVCTGAAIAFKTGRQTKMFTNLDRIYLGWLQRCFSDPKTFIPRYWNSFKLFNVMIKYQSKGIN